MACSKKSDPRGDVLRSYSSKGTGYLHLTCSPSSLKHDARLANCCSSARLSR